MTNPKTLNPALAHPPTPNPIVRDWRDARRKDTGMDRFTKAVTAALAACPSERAALADAEAKLEALHEERGRIQAAIDRLQTEPDRVETRTIHGVSIEVPSSTRRDDIAALARQRDRLPELTRLASHERDKARRRLSQSVAAKLESTQAELQKRTLGLLESTTELCRDADALELAMQTAGLEAESVYAVRFEGVQNLRMDQQGYGASIAGRLREVA